jgi:hypothetical protein
MQPSWLATRQLIQCKGAKEAKAAKIRTFDYTITINIGCGILPIPLTAGGKAPPAGNFSIA